MGYYVKVESNVKVYVEDLNPLCNKTIVFLHGWPGSSELFEYQFNKLPEKGFRCIGIDMRGFGRSDKPFTGYDYDTLSNDVRAVIEALRLKDVTLLGHSTGGSIAIRYIAKYGQGVSKLVLCAAAAPSLIKRPYFPYGLPREAVDNIISETYSDRPKMLSDFGDMFFFKHITKPFSDWFFSLGLKAASWATASVARTWIEDEKLFSDLEKIQIPTLILHGIHDKVCRFQLAEAQKKAIKHSKLIPFEFSGHGLFYDQQEKFNRELIKFIEE
ncbi:alpha/beta fold hydrolase [Clostridium cylindrosporum]|uniref:AB hydrolase superfamily protein YisY n=1 Tax=Clostridium cylindrosporum DSM 605 TaxID=1121307 RepID=A0A0J8G6Y3_CLOCY|nr:alpha/beta hydrolase [Clostridium cylindrosporum]KMT23346.1 AB hydrolase superfamily protein YisY [Clostridium cylindrosporum DSM 605]